MDLIIDGISINADHFGKMDRKEAVRRMLQDGFVPGATDDEKKKWAEKAHSLITNGINRDTDRQSGADRPEPGDLGGD